MVAADCAYWSGGALVRDCDVCGQFHTFLVCDACRYDSEQADMATEYERGKDAAQAEFTARLGAVGKLHADEMAWCRTQERQTEHYLDAARAEASRLRERNRALREALRDMMGARNEDTEYAAKATARALLAQEEESER